MGKYGLFFVVLHTMNKSEYAKLLQTDEWNEVRLRILKRDELRCRGCGATNCKLSVHHKVYIQGKNPWEVPDNVLITLCDKCHEKAHEGRLIGSFFRGDKIGKYGQSKRINKYTKKNGHRKKRQVWIEGKGLINIPNK